MSARISVYVYTSDLERMRRFYEVGLGVKPDAQHGSWLPFDLGGATFALHGVQERSAGELERVHLSFVVDDIEATVARFQVQGAKVLRGVADEAFGKRAIVEDPEGRELEIIARER